MSQLQDPACCTRGACAVSKPTAPPSCSGWSSGGGLWQAWHRRQMYHQAGRSLSCCHIRRHRGQHALQAGGGFRAGRSLNQKAGWRTIARGQGKRNVLSRGTNTHKSPMGGESLGCLSNSRAQWRGAQCGGEKKPEPDCEGSSWEKRWSPLARA